MMGSYSSIVLHVVLYLSYSTYNDSMRGEKFFPIKYEKESQDPEFPDSA